MKKRTKAYRPKPVNVCGISYVMSGLAKLQGERLTDLNLRNALAMCKMAQGDGDRDTWDQLVGAINMAIILSEKVFDVQYHDDLIAARDALHATGLRAMKSSRFLFSGDELTAMNQAMEVHSAQLAGSRVIDIERAYDEVLFRIKHRINNIKVTACE